MSDPHQIYGMLADLVLAVHFAFVLFVVAGFVLIWIGYFRQWLFVRNFYFRVAHLVAIGVVAAEALGGMVCPLTDWEAQLRWLAGEQRSYAGSFMQHWIHRVMFFDLSERTFTVLYVIFFGVVLATLWWVPPVPPRWAGRKGRRRS